MNQLKSPNMHKILSVDDEPINQAIVEELFSEQFEVALASSGEECLEKIDSIKPELILLDVSMPGIDGYQTCRELKSHKNTRDIPVFFVSARSTMEDKIKGYEAGGYDYITKPFNHAELEIKIDHTIKAARQANNPAQQQNNSLDELAQFLSDTCRQLRLNCSFQFRKGSDIFSYSSNALHNGALAPLELSLIEETLNRDRYYSFGTRLIITFAHVSLLIKNMPSDDDKHYSELQDHLGTLLEEIESRITALN